MLNSFDKMKVPESNEGAKKKLDSINKWGEDLEYDLTGIGSVFESLNFLSIKGFFDKETDGFVNTFLERNAEGFDVDIDGEALKYKDLNKGIEGMNQVITWWVHRIKSGNNSDPKAALKDAIKRWKVMVIPKITGLKELARKAAKTQAYCGKPGYEKIRDELNKKFGLQRFEELYQGSKVIGFVIDTGEFNKFRQQLDDGLYDLLNPQFVDTLPALLKGGKLNIPRMFDQEPFASMIDGLPKELGMIIKKIARSKSSSPKKVDLNLQQWVIDHISSYGSSGRPNKMTPEIQARIDDAKANLKSHGFELDEENGIIVDPDGYEIFNAGDNGEDFLDAEHDLSELIDHMGYHEAMDHVKRMVRQKLASEELE